MQEVADTLSARLNISPDEAGLIIEKAIIGTELSEENQLEEWLLRRFLPNCVFIDETGYTQMCVDALKILGTTAATDYGSSRQRDLGQLWADMTRGYLGEYGFKLFLKNRWDIEAELGHEVGALQEYLPMDIHKVRRNQENWRTPKLKIGVKAAKWNGIWFDIPGDQFSHSDIHVFIKVGTGRDHLFAFFKTISVFRDKVLKRGQEVGSLSQQEAEMLFDKLPAFKPIPAYVCGFVKKSAYYSSLSYRGKKGKKNFKITSWNGPIFPDDLVNIKHREGVSGDVLFVGIGKFSHDSGYLFNTGNLLWEDKDWKQVCDAL